MVQQQRQLINLLSTGLRSALVWRQGTIDEILVFGLAA
jgi:hypothetical protein